MQINPFPLCRNFHTMMRGVSVVVFTANPEGYPEDGREHHRQLILSLREAGVTVVAENPCHERYAVIDNALIWYGSMNLLSNERDDDTLMRLMSPEIAAELLEHGGGVSGCCILAEIVWKITVRHRKLVGKITTIV